ncbi:4Fe-4S dicluster domain-containing protein [Sutterella sp.]|uniref:4Fe-4S dicluster domain-containing protein n=1 Tax=Sutterella sp. TaxID=1981025 RepID=UPI0026DF44EA|nr:4Fe-4S dicluster domain-containing protein [Sutterella sp.]MDO5530898.1 4Fe-4S dicluster domain-containing protein [Sutterella sp.]
MTRRRERNRKPPEKPGGAKPAGLTRRGLIAGSAGAAGLLALGAYCSRETHAAPLRPPGSRDEADFLSLCLRCDRCRSACHLGAIGVAGIESGITMMRTPVMKFHLGDCDFCRKCAEVCPTGAIEDFDPETEKVGLAEVTQACIALRTGACTKCHDVCPYEAIDLDSRNRPIVNAEKCNGCGTCEYICPSMVFQSYRGATERGIVVRTFAELEARKNEGGAR